jgi:hypothetical protein
VTVRELNGYAPRSVTLGSDGEVLSVTVTAPRFTPADKAMLLAARRKAQEYRNAYGVPMSEATNPANRGKFVVPPPSVDFSAWEMAKARADAEQTYKDRIPMEALVFSVEQKP